MADKKGSKGVYRRVEWNERKRGWNRVFLSSKHAIAIK